LTMLCRGYLSVKWAWAVTKIAPTCHAKAFSESTSLMNYLTATLASTTSQPVEDATIRPIDFDRIHYAPRRLLMPRWQ
jgi:hypothetical protein